MNKCLLLLLLMGSLAFADVLKLGGESTNYYPVYFESTDAPNTLRLGSYKNFGGGKVESLDAKFQWRANRYGWVKFEEARIHQEIGVFIAGYSADINKSQYHGIVLWLRGNTQYDHTSAKVMNTSKEYKDSKGNQIREVAGGNLTLSTKTFSIKKQTQVDPYVGKAGNLYPKNVVVGGDTFVKGRVGIGTYAPSVNLHVEGKTFIRASSTGLLEMESLSGETDIQFRDPKNNQSWQVGSNSTGFFIHDDKASKYRFNINRNGNIGVNIKNPTAKLDVVGSFRVGSNSEHVFQVTDDDAKNQMLLSTSQRTQNKTPRNIHFRSFGNNAKANVLFMNMSSGRVGIGTDNPSVNLHVEGKTFIRASSTGLLEMESLSGETDIQFRDPKNNQSWQVGSNSTGFFIHDDKVAKYRFNINKSGYVGIHTTKPTTHLDIVGNLRVGSDNEHVFQVSDDSAKNQLVLSTSQRTQNKTPRNIQFRSFGNNAKANVLFMNMSSGRVGIGTTNPSATLDVNGNIITSGYVHTQGKDVYFHSKITDMNHGIGMYYDTKKFANINVNGPVVYGWWGGALGSTEGGKKIALRWDQNQNVSMNKNLSVAGNANIMGNLDVSGTVKAKTLQIDNEGWVGLNMTPEKGYTLSINGSAQIRGKVVTRGHVHTQGHDVYFHSNSADFAHGIGMYHDTKKFANVNVNGPVVYGYYGGALGSTEGGQKIALRWDKNGNVGIGVINTQGSKLAVKGKITAQEVRIINMKDWADFVFADDYELLPMDELEQSIKKHKHLPGIPSQQEVKEKGIQLGEMQAKLLQKIEELTLYTIEQNKRLQAQQKQIQELKKLIQLQQIK
ncbi:hypothetical protein [Candidatus Uabimicrobium amorphum]|uniref:Peptidase S74 domain-containing protein n=1 Tax=Uabimicrobium amorphum TaxID=2596890 RepID=A0A5S9F578_UABAM|nr:hypothetical protein [Candidatus Uabimicrobium amorphum]BBM86318.1 hypothetical protein UABAM_04704 [Candidatus Uabimicrobium amorphum]